ncbi:hypothetical protein ACFQJD_11760 [Haloplanus sp. GCM10025708]
MTADGAWAYRVDVTTERLLETAHTALAVAVADSRERFRDVVFGSRIDVELEADALAPETRDVLERAIARGSYVEQTPLSESYDALLRALGLGAVDRLSNDNLLWYDGGLYRYALYVSEGS